MTHRDGVPIKILANAAGGESARAAGAGPVRGVRPLRRRFSSSASAKDEPSAGRAGRACYGQVLAPR